LSVESGADKNPKKWGLCRFRRGCNFATRKQRCHEKILHHPFRQPCGPSSAASHQGEQHGRFDIPHAEQFYHLSKEDRDAVVKFIDSI
jgi:hypothetical protein